MARESLPLVFAAGAVSAAVATVFAYRWKLNSSETELIINLPDWLVSVVNTNKDREFSSDDEMISMAVAIASQNVSEGSGGPFGCAIFERDIQTGKAKIFSVGANRVVPLTNCTLHAEMIAIQFAQKKLKNFSMKGAKEGKEYVLCTSCEPCCMCLGGTMWSGVSELICSAAKDDAEKIGFIEGPVFPESYKQLEEMGMKVKREVKRKEGAAVLEKYGETGVIYNG
ncbi:deaminase [Seminavis robusta]|uniref:Deaminase n=1 Tax=Seminavis robusta TaxID=568900 RepID=A0A9N8DRK8_9STRA|nr:deaminase [Seminavis robusta]|eukprot:Sro238_g095640.1 deaminase (226) ;mRNA; f:72407-73171